MTGVRIAPFRQSQNGDEPRIEDILAQAQPGHKGILEFRLWAEDNGMIFRVPDTRGDKPDRGQSALTGLDWVHIIENYWSQKYGLTLQEYCRLHQGERLVEILLGTTRTSTAMHDCFWGLMFLDCEGERSLGPRNVGKDPNAPKGGGKGKHTQVGFHSHGRSGGPPAQPRAPSYDKGAGKGGKAAHRDLSTEGKGNDKYKPHTPWDEKGTKGGGKGKSHSPRPPSGKGAPKGGKPATRPPAHAPELGQQAKSKPAVYSSGAVPSGSAEPRRASSSPYHGADDKRRRLGEQLRHPVDPTGAPAAVVAPEPRAQGRPSNVPKLDLMGAGSGATAGTTGSAAPADSAASSSAAAVPAPAPTPAGPADVGGAGGANGEQVGGIGTDVPIRARSR